MNDRLNPDIAQSAARGILQRIEAIADAALTALSEAGE